ncbi:MAG: hypothetical protein UW87_C0019G0009 [Candidatus Moranbacteria bacterium GW2011_GWC2_45_10]|nr:MAG: hypothetical protein UW87_C0019G0009 [Candidatus Moranbacteria bacterium GW2011_GWC2_45_10]
MEKIILDNPWILLALVAWMIPWKGWALWRAARNGQHGWFVVLLIVNTLAILEIIYILFFSRKKIQKEEVQPEPQPKIKITHNLQKPKLTL